MLGADGQDFRRRSCMRTEDITLDVAKLSLEKPMLYLGSKVHSVWKKMQPPVRELQQSCIPRGIQEG